jgi:hypothetical protein
MRSCWSLWLSLWLLCLFMGGRYDLCIGRYCFGVCAGDFAGYELTR